MTAIHTTEGDLLDFILHSVLTPDQHARTLEHFELICENHGVPLPDPKPASDPASGPQSLRL